MNVVHAYCEEEKGVIAKLKLKITLTSHAPVETTSEDKHSSSLPICIKL